MKKLLLLGSAALILAACTPKDQPQETTAPAPDQTTSEQASEFSKVAMAIQAGQSASCQITNTETGEAMDYKIKGKKMKMTGMTSPDAAQSTAMLMDGEFIYTWNEADKKGVKMQLPSEEDMAELSQQGMTMPDLSQEAEKEKYENDGYSVNCTVTSVDESEFVPPTDVAFTDMSALMDNAMKMMGEQQ